ncbi:enolase-phosphatase E1-like [Oratosquilla oratoria]|uniref:enolase-phosphatase E1-like n=1 Tax=Oratosquilla oratoria TaxID=337810 RepID=UPI003F767979
MADQPTENPLPSFTGERPDTDLMDGVEAVLLDIDGTTTSISFVEDQLFPYARRQMGDHLQKTWSSPATQAVVMALRDQVKEDIINGVEGVSALPEGDDESLHEAVLATLLGFMDCDRKVTPLKTLQGHIWKKGYKDGHLKGHVYDDVVTALESWDEAGLEKFLFSSGSIEAQKLLFRHSLFGDLLHYFQGYFDTTTGRKRDAMSYKKISKAIGYMPSMVLFVTDVEAEARAAREAGMKVVLSVRDGTAPLSDEDKLNYPVIYSFDSLCIETAGKQLKRNCSEGNKEPIGKSMKKHKSEDNA